MASEETGICPGGYPMCDHMERCCDPGEDVEICDACADAICANMAFALPKNQSNPHSLLAHTVRLRLCWPVVWGSCSPVIVQGA